MRAPVCLVVLALLAIPDATSAQTDRAGRIHWYLEDRLQQAGSTDRLPVYFTFTDRLTFEHWFPRIDRMHIDERRALVVAELKAHAARCQQTLLDGLQQCADQGEASAVATNWLGNFVRCRATPMAVRVLAETPGLDEVRFNAAWPIDQVEDGGGPATGGGVPGNGPINTKADRVWALGIDGQGVIAMNVDTGCKVDHGDIQNRLWSNPGEIPNNGVDDDNNGFVDDVHGWNFFDDNDDLTSGDVSHGTLTAGAMVADGTCSGTVTGQAPAARLMVGHAGGCCPQVGVVNPAGEVAQWDAIQYGIQMGAHVQTSSHSYKNGFLPPPNYKMHRDVGDNSLAAGLIRTNSTSNNGSFCSSMTRAARPFNVSSPGNIPSPYLDPAQTQRGGRSGVVGCGAHDVNSNQVMSYSPCGPYSWHIEDLLGSNPNYPLANWDPAHNDYPWFGGLRQGLLKPDVTGPTNTLGLSTGSPCGLTSTTGTSTSTPRVAGSMILWKSANMSLKPEDTAMIVHQTAVESGSVQGKENTWGAGRVDALAGLHLALCVHRVNGQPAWSVDHPQGTSIRLEVDTVPDSTTLMAIGTERTAIRTHGGVVGIGGVVGVFYFGPSGPDGDVAIDFVVPVGLAGSTVYTQCFTDDGAGITGMALSSNVIATHIVP